MAEKTSIAVVGAGAIGGALAAALGDSGYTVTLCDRTPFAMLKRTFEGETRQYDHPVVTSPQGLRPVDWLLLCTKAHQVPGAAPWLECLIGAGTCVGVMQNGVDHEARVRAFVEADCVVPAIMLLPVAMRSPGEIVQRQRMDDPAARYSIALPDMAQFRGLWKRLPQLAKQRTQVTALFARADGTVREEQ